MDTGLSELNTSEPQDIAAETPLKRLSTQLTCSVCLDSYRDPKVLPCLHIFCAACLEKLVSPEATTLTCPECESTIKLSEDELSKLDAPFCIQHLFEVQDTLEKVKGEKTNCQRCGENKAMKYCSNCNEFYCQRCTEEHKEWTGFMNHKVDSMESIQAEVVSLVPVKRSEVTCFKHPGNPTEIFCETCEELVCGCCLVKTHRDHEYDLVGNCFPKHRDAITASLQPVKQQLDTVNQAVEEMDARSRRLAEQTVSIKQKIENDFKQVQEMLQTRKDKLLDQVDRLKQQSQDATDTLREGYEKLRNQLSSRLECVDESLKTGTEEEVLSIKKRVVEQMRQVEREFDMQMVKPTPEQTLRYSHQEIADACRKLGTVFLISSADPDKSFRSAKSTVTGKNSVVRPPRRRHVPDYTDYPQGIYVKTIKKLKEPRQLVITPNREIILAEREADRIAVLDKDGVRLRTFGRSGGAKALTSPRGVAMCGSNVVLVAAEHCIRKYTLQGERIAGVGMQGSSPLQFDSPWAVAFNPNNYKIYVCDTGNHRIQVLHIDLNFSSMFGSKGSEPGQFSSPTSIAVDSNGDVFVADYFNDRVQVFSPTGKFLREIKHRGPGMCHMKSPVSLCIDHNDTLYVFESNAYCISMFNREGQFVKSFGQRGDKPGEFICPYGMAVDMAGNIYVSDTHHHSIQIFR